MTGVLIKIQKNIFAITLGTAVLLGCSVAYLLSVGLKFYFQGGAVPSAIAERQRPRTEEPRTAHRTFAEFESIPTGNFIRDKGVAVLGAGEQGGPGGDGEITLQGTLAGAADFARAAIHDSVSKTVKEYRLFETVVGFKIVGIYSNSIRVDVRGNTYRIAVGEKSGEASNTEAAAPGAPPAVAGAQKVPISRQKFIALTKNPDALYKNKFAPVTKNGKIEGVKMLLVPDKDNFLYERGARTGDIIRRINGEPLENPQKMFQLWQSAQTADRFSVELERGGKIIPYEILVQ